MTCTTNRTGGEPDGSETQDAIARVLIVSRSALQGSLDERCAGLSDLIRAVRLGNAEAVSGVLALHRQCFFLVLEGAPSALREACDRIERDPRHTAVASVWQQPAARRLPERPLVFVSRDAPTRDRLAPVLDRVGPEAMPEEIDPLIDALVAAARRLGADEAGGAPAPAAEGPRPNGAGADGFDPERIRADLLALPVLRGGTFAEAAALDAEFGTAVVSGAGTLLRVNGRFARMHGYAPGELDGKPYRALVQESDLGRLAGLWERLSRGEALRTDRRSLCRDGTEVWLRSVYHPRLDAGDLLDVTEITADITRQKREQLDHRGQVLAVSRSRAVAHFALDGTLLDANDNFLAMMGYAHAEAVGCPHALFTRAEPESDAAFWAGLAEGRHCSGEFKRFAKGGRPVWLQATYSPILDMAGRPFKVVEHATDVTAERMRQADYQWQIAAIHKSLAVITFDMNGIILDANPGFLDAVGYTRDEIVGHHHRMFVEANYAHGAEYAAFWRSLARGQYQSGQYKRLGRDGREIWLQATYNPIFDMEGQPVKVVKYAAVVTDERLRQAEHQGQIAALHKAQAVISFDLDGTILDANDNFLATMGYRLAEVRGRHHRMFVTPEDAEDEAYRTFWTDLAAGRHQGGEYKRLGRDGRETWLRATYNPILDLNGRPFRIVQYAIDVTDEKLRQADVDGQIAAIRKSQGVITFALDGTITDVNETFLDALGYARAELVGRHHSLLVEADQIASRDYAAFWERLRSGSFLAGRFKRLGKDGRTVWIQATYNPILDLNGRPSKIIKFATDVTGDVALAEAYEDAKRQAQHDAATALPNRVRLASYMATALSHPGGRLVVLYIDLDRFKPINDAFGHAVGDRVLGEVANRLRRSLAPDQLAARVGGDEFVVVAPDLAEEAIEPFCQNLIEIVGAPIDHEGGELTVGASIGVAISPADGLTPDELLRAADAALYRSKRNGRGTFSFHAVAMNERVMAYRGLVDDMRRGLAAGEFHLEYQPRFDTHDRRIRCVEALVRWVHPERGRISPGDFIPLAEKSGLIVPLGDWVLRTACRTAVRWPDICVSVNVSPLQFSGGQVVASVTAALAETGLEASRLELEITEGMLMQDAALASTALADLKAQGVRLAMDDFGTGYSSLSSLRSFPFDVIKIDRQFVADIDGRDGGRDVIRAILALGKALGLSVTAEGVETGEQLRMLAEHDCAQVQGFYLARPMAAERIDALLAAAAEERAALDAGRPHAA